MICCRQIPNQECVYFDVRCWHHESRWLRANQDVIHALGSPAQVSQSVYASFPMLMATFSVALESSQINPSFPMTRDAPTTLRSHPLLPITNINPSIRGCLHRSGTTNVPISEADVSARKNCDTESNGRNLCHNFTQFKLSQDCAHVGLMQSTNWW